jgi:hypothetical protein
MHTMQRWNVWSVPLLENSAMLHTDRKTRQIKTTCNHHIWVIKGTLWHFKANILANTIIWHYCPKSYYYSHAKMNGNCMPRQKLIFIFTQHV